MIARLAIAAVLFSCSGPVAAPIQNVPARTPSSRLPEDAELGILGIAPLAERDLGSWIPAADLTALVPEHPVLPRPAFVTDSAGAHATGTFEEPGFIQYGCEGKQLGVTPFTRGAHLEPGLVWFLPADHAAWKPAPLKIVAGRASPSHRDYSIGPLALGIARTAPKRGRITITWHGRAVHDIAFDRPDMEGAENDVPLDLVAGGVGVPIPEAAWAIGDNLAIVLAVRFQRYEGTAFEAFVIDEHAGRSVKTMGMYLYYCAF
jgi:hypothetical protein